MLASAPSLLPPNEQQRQRALECYAMLDTDAEFAFDDLTRLAALVCQTPVALIGLMDQRRQWLKARVGVPTDFTEVPRERAFCDYVIASGAPLEVRDLRLDPRFATNPYVTGEQAAYCFYAGVPLRTPDGYTLGTVAVVDTRPRELTAAQRQALHTIAEQVMAQLNLKVRARQRATSPPAAPAPPSSGLDQLSALVSHDLRAPLAGLLSLTDRILGDVHQGDTSAVCASLTTMNDEVSRVQGLVSGLLDLARSTQLASAG